MAAPPTPESPSGFDNPNNRFVAYCNSQYGHATVLSSAIQSPTDPNMASEIQFGDNVSAATQQACINIAENTPTLFGGWTSLALPDTDGFLHDIITDSTISQFPVALIMGFALANPEMSVTDRQNFNSVASIWVNNAYPTQGPALLNLISGYATYRWVSLTAAKPAVQVDRPNPPPPPPPKPEPIHDFPTWLLAALQKQKPSTIITVDLLKQLVTQYQQQAK